MVMILRVWWRLFELGRLGVSIVAHWRRAGALDMALHRVCFLLAAQRLIRPDASKSGHCSDFKGAEQP